MRRAIVLAVLAVACEWPTVEPLPPSARPVDYPVPGTPGATATMRLVVLARDGAPASTAVHLVLSADARRLGIGLAVGPADPLGDSIAVTSDARGVATAAIHFGVRAGRAAIRALAPGIALDDSLVYELPDGPVAALDVDPIDPPIAGDTVVVRWRAFAGGGQPAFGAPDLDVADTTVAAFIGQDSIRTRRTGATWIRVREGTAGDSVPLAVVPAGAFGALTGGQWVITPTGGRPATPVFSSTTLDGARYSPSRDSLAYTDGNAIRLRLPGGGSTLLAPAALGFYTVGQPEWSADGQWIYLTAATAPQQAEIWRVHPDGSGAERVGPVAAAGEVDQMPAVHADGQLLAFVTNRVVSGGQPTVRIMSGGAVVYSGPAGGRPRFAPDGSRLAFLSNGNLMLVNADGTGLRALVATLDLFAGQISWSSDGQWILVARGGSQGVPRYLYLVDTVSDSAIRLPYSLGWSSPEWR